LIRGEGVALKKMKEEERGDSKKGVILRRKWVVLSGGEKSQERMLKDKGVGIKKRKKTGKAQQRSRGLTVVRQ